MLEDPEEGDQPSLRPDTRDLVRRAREGNKQAREDLSDCWIKVARHRTRKDLGPYTPPEILEDIIMESVYEAVDEAIHGAELEYPDLLLTRFLRDRIRATTKTESLRERIRRAMDRFRPDDVRLHKPPTRRTAPDPVRSLRVPAPGQSFLTQESEAEQQLRREVEVHKALSRLPALERDLVYLAVMEERPMVEVQAHLGLSPWHCLKLKEKALARLSKACKGLRPTGSQS